MVFREDADVGGGHAVAVGVFYQVHGFIGQVQQAFLGARIDGIRSDAHAGRDVDVQPVFIEPDRSRESVLCRRRGHVEGIVFGSLRQQDHKFVAAIAKRKIDQPAVRLQRIANFREQPGADQMAVRVVDLLEVIEIDEHQREFVVVALRTVDFRLQDETHVPRVVQRWCNRR